MSQLYKEYFSGKRFVITGGLGFIGSNLAHRLLALHAQVTILDALLPLYGGNMYNIEPVADQLELLVGDIRDESLVKTAVTNTDVVIHLAAQTSHVDSMRDPFTDIDINCRGTLVLLEMIRKFNPDCLTVYISSRAVYGTPASVPVNEESPVCPVDVYGASKAAAENYHQVYARTYGIPTMLIRCSNVYGPRHQMKHNQYGIVNWFVRLALDNTTIPVFGDGSQLRDYCYVADAVDGTLSIIQESAFLGEIVNLGSGTGMSVMNAAETIAAVSRRGSVAQHPWPQERKDIEIGNFITDISKLSTETGWRPQWDFHDGIAETIAFYEQHRDYYWS